MLSACAKPPEQIAAEVMPASSFSDRSCSQLASLAVTKQVELAELATLQRETAEEDKNAMSAIHIPVGSIGGGDREADVARTKGEIQAVSELRRLKGCGTP